MPKYHTRDLLVRDDIMNKAKQLADMICTTEEVTQYQHAEKQIQDHSRVQELIALMKKKQKEIVAFESFQNQEMVKKIEAEIEALQDELDQIPLVVQFQQSQTDVNYLLQLVMGVIRDTVADKVNVEDASEPAPDNCSE
ncbi:RicAFT regulatory complex protein RicA family protein [Paenibacillus sp. 1001270B_150601_E10]|uniref:RicAFT regulatory complex protein RicA family protein n=1 Tax=Paenibacillus sp. 1001270B_150601_E10 TaxID=2787079 RepID=UPI00189CCA32|nr:YlbF family regulator [Paenibacillus sp. 1001270B_150601_E10]